jgi:hypothetical protein
MNAAKATTTTSANTMSTGLASFKGVAAGRSPVPPRRMSRSIEELPGAAVTSSQQAT